jgi:FMN-dependent NADH-azoreductase
MKYLAINGSGKGKKSSSMKIAKSFFSGIKSADSEADIEIIHLAESDIQNCNGCFYCWIKDIMHGVWREHPVDCVKDKSDDMINILAKYKAADKLIFISPVYFFNISSLLQKFIERTLPFSYSYYLDAGGDNNDLPQKPLILIATYSKYLDNLFVGIRNQLSMINPAYQAIFSPSPMLKFKSASSKTFFDDLDVVVKTAGGEFAKESRFSDNTMLKLQEFMCGDVAW